MKQAKKNAIGYGPGRLLIGMITRKPPVASFPLFFCDRLSKESSTRTFFLEMHIRKDSVLMNTPQTNMLSNREISTRKLCIFILIAATIATAANSIFYFFVTRFLGEPLLFPEHFPPPETSPIPVTDVMIFSVIFSIGAGIMFFGLQS